MLLLKTKKRKTAKSKTKAKSATKTTSKSKSSFAKNGAKIFSHASKIRKPGEVWQDAVKRASKELHG